MTPDQLEHLRKIDEHLEKLLSQAEKRTPGRWIRERYVIKQPSGRVCADVGPHHTPPNEYPPSCQRADDQNGDFIALCAGNAEAGWKATRAAIAMIGVLSEYDLNIGETVTEMIKSILAAFPLELTES
jgi:hypothetical protein